MTDQPYPRASLFSQLLQMAFDHSDQGSPTLVTMGVQDPLDPEFGRGQFESWLPDLDVPRRSVEQLERLPTLAMELLNSGPVLLLPPWGRNMGPRDSDALRPLSRHMHEDTLLRCNPPPGSHALGVLLPMAAWSVQGSQRFRELIARHWSVSLLVYSTGAFEAVHPAFASSFAILRARSVNDSNLLRIFQMPDGNTDMVRDDFQRLLARDGGSTSYGFVVRDAIAPGESLAYERHDPRVLERRTDLAAFGSTVLLSELFEVVRAGLNVAEDWTKTLDRFEEGLTRVLRGRDIGNAGSISAPDEDTRWAAIAKDRMLEPGDFVARAFTNPNDHRGLVVAEVSEADLPCAVASSSVIALRPLMPLSEEQRIMALLFLRSSLVRDLLRAEGASGFHVSPSSLRRLPIPIPDEAMGAAVCDLNRAASQLQQWKSDVDALLKSVFADDSAAAARKRIVETGRTLRLRVEAASLLDDLGYTVRTRFPYPIAFRWRTFEAEVSHGTTRAAYDSALECAEVLLGYAALSAMAFAHWEACDLKSRMEITAKLSSGRTGPGFGDWVNVLDEVSNSRGFRAVPAESPLAMFRGVLSNGSDAHDARVRLAARRNDEAHLRRVDESGIPAALEEVRSDLETLLEAFEFLADLPLVHITAAQWDSLRGDGVVQLRELMGDHAVVPSKTIRSDDPDLEIGSLYLLGAEGHLHLIRPHLIGRLCPECRNWSTFHVDQVRGGVATLKSLEHGHTMVDEDCVEALYAVDLLLTNSDP